METIKADIKPGPKRKTEEGKEDRRQRVTPENQPKHPTLKPHDHDKKNQFKKANLYSWLLFYNTAKSKTFAELRANSR